ncbi:MAG: hypothetical protein QXR40_04595 [Candidatus Bathyarchaeia archaeon]
MKSEIYDCAERLKQYGRISIPSGRAFTFFNDQYCLITCMAKTGMKPCPSLRALSLYQFKKILNILKLKY